MTREMTIEEAKKELKKQIDLYEWQLEDINKAVEPRRYEQYLLAIMSFKIAVETLQQEPCEDCISREDALMALTGEWTDSTDELIHRFIRRIRTLSPVTPQPKTGHWIEYDHGLGTKYYQCSICKGFDNDEKGKYCKWCGTKMKEVEKWAKN